MPSSTQNKRKHRYSPNETLLLGFLPKGGKPISSIELIEKLYADKEKPLNARQSVASYMTSLMNKVEWNEEPFRIQKAVRSGPYPMEYTKVSK